MSDYRKRSTKRKKRKEATLVGDLFKILFAVSMLIIAILVAFFVFKNVSGFHLPDLRVTAAETQESETATVVSIDTKESAAVETSAQIQVTESAQLPSRKDTEIEGPVPGSDSQGEVSNGPVVGPDTVKESPETVQKDGAVISEGGPLGG